MPIVYRIAQTFTDGRREQYYYYCVYGTPVFLPTKGKSYKSTSISQVEKVKDHLHILVPTKQLKIVTESEN